MKKVFGLLPMMLLLAACDNAGPSYTLYRSSPLDTNARIHLASFDAAETGTYNQENCELARNLFARQPGVAVRYWCEQGKYKK